MPDSATLDLPLVLHGAIEQITGAAMPGAHVLLWAWPSNESVRRVPVGGELELTPVARTVADDAGTYVLRTPVTDLLRSLSGRDGLDIQLDVFHGDRHYTHLSQVTPTADGKWIRELTGLVEPVGKAVEAAGNLLDLTLDRTKAAVEGGLGIVGTGPVATEFRKPVPPGCTPFEKVGDVIVPETVATAVARNGAGVDVMYTAEAKTESSTGGSFLGGAFAINGSRSRTFGLEANFVDLMSTRRKSVNQEYQVLMLHNIWRRSCARDFRGNEDVLYITNPAGAPEGDGQGTGFPEKSRYPSWKCTPNDGRTVELGGADSIATVDDRAAVYQAGFTFEPIPGNGFSGNTLSGYSSAVKVIFTFDKKTDVRNRFWCGRTGKPRAPGQRVQGFAG